MSPPLRSQCPYPFIEGDRPGLSPHILGTRRSLVLSASEVSTGHWRLWPIWSPSINAPTEIGRHSKQDCGWMMGELCITGISSCPIFEIKWNRGLLGNPLASVDHTQSIYSENWILKSSEKKLKKSSVIFEKYLKSICSFQHAKQLSVKYFSKNCLISIRYFHMSDQVCITDVSGLTCTLLDVQKKKISREKHKGELN